MDLKVMDKEIKREENEEVFEASDNLREVPISARAAETDSARAKVVAGELEHELEELQSGEEEAQAHIVGGGDKDLPAENKKKKKRKRRKKKKQDRDPTSAASAVVCCDAINDECDVKAGQPNQCADKENNDCADLETKTSLDQGDSEKGRRKQMESSQLGDGKPEEIPPGHEKTMAQGDDLSNSFAEVAHSNEQQNLVVANSVGSGKKKRNRRRKKQNRVRAGNEEVVELSCQSGSTRKELQSAGSVRDSETRNAKQTTPSSHEISARRNTPRRTPRNRGNQRRPLYEAYWQLEKVSAALKRQELMKGVLRISPRNYELAWVTVPGLKRDVVLEGMLMRNRALNGDIVALEILPKQKWRIMKDELDYNGITLDINYVEETIAGLHSLSLSPGNESQSPSTSASGHIDKPINVDQVPEEFLQRTGKVVYIIEKKHSRVASGNLKPFPHPKECPDGCFSPADSRLPRIRIPRDQCPPGFFDRPRDFEKTLLVARIVSWPETSSRNSFLAVGSIARSLGEAGEIEPETEGILLEYGIDSGPFSDEALACLPLETPWKIPEKELEYRRDFRDDCVFTIDPLTARDLDDAVHCKKIQNGCFEVGVHIADVSFFVRRGTALDEVAIERATSTYMVQKVIPMLPRRLCEELCSLNPGEDRLTFSIVWHMSEKGEILDEWKGRGIIRSRVKMAYEHAQDMIEKPNRQWNPSELPPISDGATVEQISAQVNQLHKFALRLRRNRFENGALRLDQVKLQFDLDKETGLPNGYHVHKQRDANKLIEEFMLLANMAIAHHIYVAYPETALLRRHPKPHEKQLEDVIEICRSFGINFNGTSSKTIQDSLSQFPLSSPEREVLVNLTMRPMKNAEYFCTGSVEEDQYGHYALCVPLYTHFTSPIRRYADVVVHRLLAASLGIDEPLNQDPDGIDMIAGHCNDRKLAAKRASELSNELFFGIFVRESGPLEEDGMVLNVMDQSLDILVPQLGVVKRVYLKFCPGVKSFEFTKGEKGKPAEIRLRWSVKLKSGDEPYEEEQILKIFDQVRLILTTESQTENKRANPFKVMGKLVPKLACGDEYYIPSTSADHKTDGKKNAVCSSKTVHGPISANIRAADDIRKKLFESEQEPEGPRTSEQGSEICHREAAEIESHSSDDVIVESEEEASALPNGNDKSTKATEDNSDDVIVESETDPEEG